MHENRADCLSNNLRLNKISILSFSQFYFKIDRNQLEIVVKATYGLHPISLWTNKMFYSKTYEEKHSQLLSNKVLKGTKWF